MISKNIFDYATKELSQDAFLCWLFANIDNPEVSDCANEVLNHIFKITNFPCKAESMIVRDILKQKDDIDIVVNFTFDANEYALVIEDKTESGEHNQLLKYNDKITKWNKKTIKVFYKTDYIFREERQRVENANWSIFEYEQIYNIFRKYTDNKNIIINDYANHLCARYEKLLNDGFPKTYNDNDLWVGFFRNYLEKDIKDKCDSWSMVIGAYDYAVLGFRPFGKYFEKIPYMEIRSRDLEKGFFEARLSLYGSEEFLNKIGLDNFKNIVKKYEVDGKYKYFEKRKKKFFVLKKSILIPKENY